MKFPIFFFCIPVFCMSALHAEDNIVIDPVRFMPVIGKKGDNGFFIPVKNNKGQFVMSVRTAIRPYCGRLLLQGQAEGKIRAVWLMIIALKNGKKVYDKGVWLTGEKLLKEKNDIVRFSGILNLTGVEADQFYFYFQTFNGKESPVRPISFTIMKQED